MPNPNDAGGVCLRSTKRERVRNPPETPNPKLLNPKRQPFLLRLRALRVLDQKMQARAVSRREDGSGGPL